MIPTRSALVRSAALFALCLPLSSLACSGSAFSSSGGPDGSSGDDSGDGGGVVVVGDGGDLGDAHHDAHHDGAGPVDSGMPGDSGVEDSGAARDSGNGCPAGFLACDGGCLASGAMNCGTCGNDCSNLAHVSGPASCSAGGTCSFPMTSCAPGWADCDGKPGNGCEADTTQSPNCGGCGVTCPTGMPVCDGTGCVTGCSGAKPDLCGMSCTDTTSDPQNCSSCGHVCAAGPTNSQASCTGGVCGYKCNSGYSDCNLGCVDEQNDPNNCGTCGANCNSTNPPPANGTDVCSTGTCDFTCSAGFTKCAAAWACQAPAGTGAYVQAGSGFMAPNCGTSSSPCSTVHDGIGYATQHGLSMVYVADGTYSESISITAPVTIQGGWSAGSWVRDCPPNPATTKLEAPIGASQTVAVNGGISQVTLDTISVINGNAAGAGQTLYGVVVDSGTAVDLRNVIIDVAGGGAGGGGLTGMSAGATQASCIAGDGLAGGSGTLGTGAAVGTYSSSGYSPTTGMPGGVGVTGHNGTAAVAPVCLHEHNCLKQPTPPYTCNAIPTDSCGTAGTNGCGGYGSGGGTPGIGGGSSIGLFVWGGTVTMDGPPGQVVVASGGNGGDGGGSGLVGIGTYGGPGKKSTDVVCLTCDGTCWGQNCAVGPAGAAGGTGGNGGPGGKGGGGSGGDSYCYVMGGGGTVTTTWPSSFCTSGTGGNGGNQGGGTGQGANGRAGMHD